ncbi:MAG: hypothetical protein RLZZ502_1502 [Pseudomonadota bacterium]|jgi:phosphoglycerate kinase
MNFKQLTDLSVSGKRVFIRADLNVPQNDDGSISDDTRIRASLPGIQYALSQGAQVMVTSHLGRPTEGEVKPEDSLAPIATRLAELLDTPVRLISNWVDGGFSINNGELVVLENCRCNKGEKKNDTAMAAKMAALCDVYVNDAFGTAHRAEATTEGIARYAPIACAGPLMAGELTALTQALAAPRRPLWAIVAGSKVSTKLTILDSLADKVDGLIVGGGIANTFLMAQGHAVGKSLAEPDLLPQATAVMAKMAARGAAVPMAVDVVCAKKFAADAEAQVKLIHEVEADDLILDIGPQTAQQLAGLLKQAGTIVWNGPVGVFEFPAFAKGTEVLARAIAEAPGFSLAGGGDTIAAINQFGIAAQVNYISTAGGAFLEFLEGKQLPAVVALESRAQV